MGSGAGKVRFFAGAFGVFVLGLAVGIVARGEPIEIVAQSTDRKVEQVAVTHAAELAITDQEPQESTMTLAQAEQMRDKWKDARGVNEKGELLWELTALSYTEYYPESERFKLRTEYFKGAPAHCKTPTEDCYVKLQKRFDKNGKLIEKFVGNVPSLSLKGVREIFDRSSAAGDVEKEQQLVDGTVVREKLKGFSAEAPMNHSIAGPVSVVYRRDKKQPMTTRGWVYDAKNKLRFFFTRVGDHYKSAKAFDSTGKVLFDRSCEDVGACDLS